MHNDFQNVCAFLTEYASSTSIEIEFKVTETFFKLSGHKKLENGITLCKTTRTQKFIMWIFTAIFNCFVF